MGTRIPKERSRSPALAANEKKTNLFFIFCCPYRLRGASTYVVHADRPPDPYSLIQVTALI